jgi:hypothetical protein
MNLGRCLAFLLLCLVAQTVRAESDGCCESVDDCSLSEEGDMHPECVNYDPQTRDPVPCNETQAGWCAYFYSPAATYRPEGKVNAKNGMKPVAKIKKPTNPQRRPLVRTAPSPVAKKR